MSQQKRQKAVSLMLTARKSKTKFKLKFKVLAGQQNWVRFFEFIPRAVDLSKRMVAETDYGVLCPVGKRLLEDLNQGLKLAVISDLRANAKLPDGAGRESVFEAAGLYDMVEYNTMKERPLTVEQVQINQAGVFITVLTSKNMKFNLEEWMRGVVPGVDDVKVSLEVESMQTLKPQQKAKSQG